MTYLVKCEWCGKSVDMHSDEWGYGGWYNLTDSEHSYDYCPVCKPRILTALMHQPENMDKITEMYRCYDKLVSAVDKWSVGQCSDKELRTLLREITLERRMLARHFKRREDQ